MQGAAVHGRRVQRADLARLPVPRTAALARSSQRDMRLRAACPATRRIEPVLSGHRVGAQHPAVVGRSTGSARGLLEPYCQRKTRRPRDVHPHPGRGRSSPVLRELGLSAEELAQQIEERLTRYNDDAILNIRQEEYRQLMSGTDTPGRDAREFEVRNVRVPDSLRPFLGRVVRVVRLREVRALKGFTRINPPGDEDSPGYRCDCRRRARLASGGRGSGRRNFPGLQSGDARTWKYRTVSWRGRRASMRRGGSSGSGGMGKTNPLGDYTALSACPHLRACAHAPAYAGMRIFDSGPARAPVCERRE